MYTPESALKKYKLFLYRVIINNENDATKFYDSVKNFSPLKGRRLQSINPGYLYNRYDAYLTEEEASFLTLQLSTKSELYKKNEYYFGNLVVNDTESD